MASIRILVPKLRIHGIDKSKAFTTKREAVAWSKATEKIVNKVASMTERDKLNLSDAQVEEYQWIFHPLLQLNVIGISLLQVLLFSFTGSFP